MSDSETLKLHFEQGFTANKKYFRLVMLVEPFFMQMPEAIFLVKCIS